MPQLLLTISWALSWQNWTLYPSWTFDQNCLDMWPLEVHVKLSFSFPFNALRLRYSLLNIFISKTAWRSNGKKYHDFHLFLHIKNFPLLEGGEGSGGNCPHWVFIAPTLPSLWEGARQGGGQSLLRSECAAFYICLKLIVCLLSSGEQESSPGHRDNVQECPAGCCPTDGWAFSWQRGRVTL